MDLYELFNKHKDDVMEDGSYAIDIKTIKNNGDLASQLILQNIITFDGDDIVFNNEKINEDIQGNQSLIYNIKTGEIKKYYVVRNYECK